MWSIIQAAGWPIWPLILASIAALAIVIERTIALRQAQVNPSDLSDQVGMSCTKGLPSTDAIAGVCGTSVAGDMLAHALQALHQHPNTSAQDWRINFEEAGRLAQDRLQRYLGALATIASAAPLLGLLGTVVGMIDIFAAQSAAGTTQSDPTQLAHGISVALYNTAFGLMVAIPSLMAWRILRARVDRLTLDLELQAEAFWRQHAAQLCRSVTTAARTK